VTKGNARLRAVTLKFVSEGDSLDIKLISKPFDNKSITMQVNSSRQGNLLEAKFAAFVSKYQQLVLENESVIEASKILNISEIPDNTASEIIEISKMTANGIQFTRGKLTDTIRNLFNLCEENCNLKRYHAELQLNAGRKASIAEAARQAF